MDFDFLSEPITQEDVEKSESLNVKRTLAPEGEYEFIIVGIKGQLSSVKRTPMLKISLEHTGEARKHGRIVFQLFNTVVGKDQLSKLAIACGLTKEASVGLRWGFSGEEDQWGRQPGFIVDANNENITDQFLGKQITAVTKHVQLPTIGEDGNNIVKSEVRYIKTRS